MSINERVYNAIVESGRISVDDLVPIVREDRKLVLQAISRLTQNDKVKSKFPGIKKRTTKKSVRSDFYMNKHKINITVWHEASNA